MSRHQGGGGSGALLHRLADAREPEFRSLARAVGADHLMPRHDTAPEPALVRRLASVPGLHAADLFAAAGVAVPGDLAPVDQSAGPLLPGPVARATALPPPQREVLRRFAALLPQERSGAAAAVPAPAAFEDYPAGPGRCSCGRSGTGTSDGPRRRRSS
ncbi:hypothetical protein [Streptomyces sp. NRRL B-24484]|uniref:hypothetical protein n=1 Tax=Streptomyces sp. NRRL B-24484 TaxID=1463833 RepID=UPI0004C14280|nr:hypothetical protein [Streptomyces sp. NRRL B-24484]